jgi:hypothetical protein
MMTHMKTTLFMAAPLLTAVAFSTSAHADPDTDETFLMTIHHRGIYVSEPVTQAHAVCAMMHDNPDDTFADVARGLAAYDPSITRYDVAFFAGAAIAAYCPQYKSLVNDGT